MSTQQNLLAAIETLSQSGDEAVAAIDAKIAELNSELEKYKRMRRLLVGSDEKPKSRSVSPDVSAARTALADRVFEILKATGPLKAAEIADHLGDVSYHLVGKAVKSDERFDRLTGGRVMVRGS